MFGNASNIVLLQRASAACFCSMLLQRASAACFFLSILMLSSTLGKAQTTITTGVTLTGGPTPNPAVVGQTVATSWKATVTGVNSTQTECLIKNARWTWSVTSYKFRATNSTTDTVLDFNKDPNKVTIVPNGDTARFTMVPATGGGKYTLVVKANYSCNSSECGPIGTIPDATGSTNFDVKPVGSFVLHPSVNDFQGGFAGRVLARKQLPSDTFYTVNNTSKSNTPAQTGTGDSKIFITAHLPKDQVGTTVYFRISDPADGSPYHSGSTNDNGWGGGSKGTAVGTQQATASLANINGSQIAAAEITLDVGTDAGNNFDVEASLKPFNTATAADIQKTPRLVAWKRYYLEKRNMYKMGLTVFGSSSKAGSTILTTDFLAPTDSTTQFTTGYALTIFFRDPILYNGRMVDQIERSVISSTPNPTPGRLDVEVANIPFAVPQFSGIKFGSEATYGLSRSDFNMAYGANTDGSDGGGFAEFKVISERNVPLVYKQHGSASTEFAEYWKYWSPILGSTNIIANGSDDFVLGAACTGESRYDDGHTGEVGGLTKSASNISCVYVQTDGPTWSEEAAVHEIGHQLIDKISVAHIDVNINVPSHDGRDNCIMTYPPNGNRNDGITEFDELCLKQIRKADAR